MTHKDALIGLWHETQRRWKLSLAGAILGGTSMILLTETARWLLGKGFFQ